MDHKAINNFLYFFGLLNDDKVSEGTNNYLNIIAGNKTV